MEKKIILWTEELATGIAWQDIQHREFLKFTNALFDEFYANKGYLELESSLQKMELYTRDHFKTEERYMDLFQYPESDAHKSQHQDFRQFIVDMKAVESNSTLEGARLCNKLNNWFVDHIKIIDQALGKFLAEKEQK